MDKLECTLLSYNREGFDASDTVDAGSTPVPDGGDGLVHWADIRTLADKPGITALLERFGIHRLITEDILNVNQMVKMDNYDDCLFLVLKMLDYDRNGAGVTEEHVSIVLKDNCIFSFQECGGDLFEDVRQKIESGRENVRRRGADYLCYELVDTVVDNYFRIIDQFGDETDSIEEELIAKPDRSTLEHIYFVKRRLMRLRKSVYPLREVIGSLCGTSSGQVSGDVKIYFHDVYDHLIQIVDSIETYQDILSNMLDIYLSSVSNKTNDTMKILTIFSTIFIPLTFLAGIYGMNFEDIPELHLKYGYICFWAVSLLIAALMLLFFHRKKWL